MGTALRSIRTERGWSLADASAQTGLSASTWSKIENGQRSLTYDKLLDLAHALSVDISRLFSNNAAPSVPDPRAGRRSVQRGSEGFVVEAGVYTYNFLAQDLMRKRFLPVLMELHAHSVEDFDQLLKHEGDEFAFVLEGAVDVHTDVYAPLRLLTGQSVYFDSSVGHAYVNAGTGVARILTIACDAEPRHETNVLPVAKASAANHGPRDAT